MFFISTLIGLLRLLVRSYQRSGHKTDEYKALYTAFLAGLKDLAPTPFQETPPPPSWEYELSPAEIVAGASVGKLEAVKVFKNRTGRPLMECKKTVERFFERHGLQFKGYG
jgi:hypothetical protein